MKRFLKTVFCVMTICAMVSFVGCGGDEKGGADGAKAGDTSSAEGGSDEKGSDAK